MQFKGLTLDEFQIQAFEKIDEKESIIVSAPTGSGKTLLVDYAIENVLNDYKRLIYTSPIKALSNQKFRDFSQEYGKTNVGILTGDISINRDAPILIMTTEILRNMLYLDPEGTELQSLAYVVFDEIHYINDQARGVVWEESLILLPDKISIIMLSATIPNAIDIKNWMESIKQQTFALISHEIRPVPLHPYYYNGTLKKYNGSITSNVKQIKSLRKKQKNQRKKKSGRKREDKLLTVFGNDFFSPIEIVSTFNDSFFPVIYFIFSRKACEKASGFLYESHLNLTTKTERNEIFRHIKEYQSNFDSIEHLEQVDKLLKFVKRGIAFHHAGCIPILKEFVETLFAKGLVKVLFATETFAMGLNLPAKTVVFHSIEKFDGFDFRLMSAGEFNQMAGRAGRRGIDTYGNAILVHDLRTDDDDIINIFDGESDPLESKFRLSYNSICNLLQGRDLDEIIILLKSSFKEHTAEIVRQVRNKELIRQIELINNQIKKGIPCNKGFDNENSVIELEKFIGLNREYKALHTKISLDTSISENKDPIEFIWNVKLALGRVVSINDKINDNTLLGVIIGHEKDNKIMNEDTFFPTIILAENGTMKRYLPHQYNIFSIIYPFNNIKAKHYEMESKSYLKLFEDIKLNLKHALHSKIIEKVTTLAETLIRKSLEEKNIKVILQKYNEDEYKEIAKELDLHYCNNCELLKNHRRDLIKINRQKVRLNSLTRKLKESENLSYDAFKKMLAVLHDFKFVSKKDNELNNKGYILANVHHDNDVLISELIERKMMTGLKSGELVCLFAMLSLEKKEKGRFERTPRIRNKKIIAIYNELKNIDNKFRTREEIRNVPSINITRGFSLRLVEIARLWADNYDLEDLSPLTTMSEGDIVNHLRRVLNLMTQVRAVIYKFDIGVTKELFDEAIKSLKRSHVVPMLDDVDETLTETEKLNIDDNEDEDSSYLKLR